MSTPRVFAVVPAAGAGRRMGSATPKQYLDIAGRTVLEHTLRRLAGLEEIAEVLVAVADDDARFAALTPALPANCRAVTGGAERSDSVLNGLRALAGVAAESDWALVHDAARPCVRQDDIRALFAALADHAVGGLLAIPVRDTLKRCAADGDVSATVDRSGLWQAQTPQLFRYGVLLQALEDAQAAAQVVTDEAQAVERHGLVPRVVEGHADNIKITRPEDLGLARMILAAQREHAQ